MRLVIVESPYAGNVEANVAYARYCVRDCLDRGEAPFASHLIYPQTNILDDNIPEQRNRGIAAGLEWGRVADATVIYTDLGISPGMGGALNKATLAGRTVEYRQLPLHYRDQLAAIVNFADPFKSPIAWQVESNGPVKVSAAAGTHPGQWARATRDYACGHSLSAYHPGGTSDESMFPAACPVCPNASAMP